MRRVFELGGLALIPTLAPVVVLAASITNRDAEPLTLVVTENGERTEIVVSGNQTQSICTAGCFITLPLGDRIVLSGNENVSISAGRAIID